MLRPLRLISALILLSVTMSAHAQATSNPAHDGLRKPQYYTAEFKITTIQALPDGTTITQVASEVRALDLQGRRLFSSTEATPTRGNRPPSTTVSVSASDGGSTWNSRTRTGTITRGPPPEQRHGCWGNDAGQLKVSFPDHPRRVTSPQKVASTPDEVDIVVPESAKTNAEDLGIETIAGLEAHGHRFTDTIPSGEIGNDRPILAVQEIWSAAGLDFPLRDVRTDPRFGKRIREVVRLDLAEPDPALFEPPADYEMKTEELRQIPCPQ